MPQEAIPSEKACKKHSASHLEASLSDELLQCSSFLNTEFAKKALGTTASSHSSTPAISLDETNEDTDTKDDTNFNVELPELCIAITVEYGCVSLRMRFFFPKFWNDKTNFTRVFVTVSPRRPWDRRWSCTCTGSLNVSNNLESVFPNTVIAFCTYLRLSMMVSNCSGERSFSKLKF